LHKQYAVSSTDGRHAYGAFNSAESRHLAVLVASGENAPKVLGWVYSMIATGKGNIHGVYHGLSPKHPSRFLFEFCHQFNPATAEEGGC